MSNSKWILLAEDNPIDADLALRALNTNAGKDAIVHANDGAEALDCLYRRGTHEARKTGHPTVVLLDLKMPKVDGLEVLRKIKSDPDLKQVPVVMFTSSREEMDLARCYESGVNAYVVKPVAFADYRTVLQHVQAFWMMINELPSAERAETVPVGSRLVPAD